MKRMGWSIAAIAMIALSVHADPTATQPTTLPADTPAVAELRQQLLDWDVNTPKMSLEEFRKTFHTENEREATYCDFLAIDNLETLKTEQAVRDKWGPAADAKFAHMTGMSTAEDDRVCHISVDGNHATVSWDLDGMKPEKFIKLDGHWLADNHTMFADWLKDDPTMETDKNPTGKLMKQVRSDIAADKYDDADGFIADFKKKWEGGN
jgi:hypothetical protein